MPCRMPVIIAFLGIAIARQYACRYAIARTGLNAGKAMTRGQRKNAASGAGACAFAIGDARHSPRRIFTFQRRRTQESWVRIKAIITIKIWNGSCQQTILRRETGILVLGRFFRHVDGAGDEPCQNVGIHVGR